MSNIPKKIICLLTMLAVLASIAGCGKTEDNKNDPSPSPGATAPIDDDDKDDDIVMDPIDNNVKYDPNVVPIKWDSFKTDPLTGELAEGIRYLIGNGTKYIVNDWWNKVKKFNTQENKEYLTLSGNGEHDIRPLTHQARTLAAAIKLNIYDESAAKVSKEDAKQMAVKLTKSLAKAHSANTSGGWGNAWQSAYWAADVAQAGWLLWDEFSETDREYIQKCVVAEADRFIDYTVPYYMDKNGKVVFKGDSKAEENAWNSNILSVACAMMPNHENYNAWMYKNIELMISSFATPGDVTSDKTVSGFKLSALLKGSNANADGTVTNHNIVHPDYQSTIAINFLNGIFFAFGNQTVPEAVLFNADKIYKAFVDLDLKDLNKNLSGQHIYKRNANGSASPDLNYPNGTDWGTDRQINFFLVDVFAEVFSFDKDCTLKGKDFALARLPVMKAMQDRNTTGQYYKAGDSDTYVSREEWVMWHAIVSYMALWADANDMLKVTGKNPIKPAPLTEVRLSLANILTAGKSYTASYKLNPGLISLPKEAAVTYASSNDTVISVTNSGEIKAKAKGSADITVTITYKEITVTDKKTVQVASEAAPTYNFDDLPTGGDLPSDFYWNSFGQAKIIDDNGNNVLELSGSGYNYIFIGDDFSEDFTLEFKMKLQTHSAKGGGQVLFREDSSKFTGRNGYQFLYGDAMNGEFGLELRKRDTTLSDNKYAASVNDGAWHAFKITMSGDTATLFMDGKQIMTHELTGFTSGSVAVCSYLDTVLFDDIKITVNS